LLAISLALYALYLYDIQFRIFQSTQEVAEMRYQQEEKPSITKQEVLNQILLLHHKIERARNWLISSNISGDSFRDLQHSIEIVENYVFVVETKWGDNELENARRLVNVARKDIDSILLELSEIVNPDLIVITYDSPDGWVKVSIDEATSGRTKEGSLLDTVTITMGDPPDSERSSAHAILVFDIGPDGATFDHPITVTLFYDPTKIPAGFKEKDLVVATWDRIFNKWDIIQESIIDYEEHSITVYTNHLTLFAILTVPPEQIRPAGWPIIFTSVFVTILLTFFVSWLIVRCRCH